MKTIKEIADICNVSKTSINRAIAELNIEKTLSGNKNLISDTDADRIVSLLRGFGKTCAEINPNQNKTETESIQNETNKTESSSSVFPETSKNDDSFIEFLKEQIKVKDSQISQLQEENRMLIQAQAFTIKQLERLSSPELIGGNEENISNPEPKEEEKAESTTENTTETQQKKRKFLFWNRKK